MRHFTITITWLCIAALMVSCDTAGGEGGGGYTTTADTTAETETYSTFWDDCTELGYDCEYLECLWIDDDSAICGVRDAASQVGAVVGWSPDVYDTHIGECLSGQCESFFGDACLYIGPVYGWCVPSDVYEANKDRWQTGIIL
jgi:hypothetical protein